MFGRELGLPVDFLLGRIEDPVPGEVQNWVLQHQARPRVAFDGPHEQLLVAAGREKERHNQRVHEAPLEVGQLVYVRDHGARGRHKIHDIWSSVVHQILKAPLGEGAVYAIATVTVPSSSQVSPSETLCHPSVLQLANIQMSTVSPALLTIETRGLSNRPG